MQAAILEERSPLKRLRPHVPVLTVICKSDPSSSNGEPGVNIVRPRTHTAERQEAATRQSAKSAKPCIETGGVGSTFEDACAYLNPKGGATWSTLLPLMHPLLIQQLVFFINYLRI